MKDQSGNENRITILEDLSNNIVINPLFNNLEELPHETKITEITNTVISLLLFIS